MELVIKIDADGAVVRTENKQFVDRASGQARGYTSRFQVGRMVIVTADGPMESPVRVPLYQDESGYQPGEYGVASASFDRKRSGFLEFNRLQLAPRKVEAAVKPVRSAG